MPKIWINEREAVDIDREQLSGEIATDSRFRGVAESFAWLPDPDPVLRRLGADIQVYRTLLSDAHVWSCYDSRKSGTLRREWKIVAASEGGSQAANQKAHELCKSVAGRIGMRKLISDILDAPFFGMSPIEVVWQYTGGQWIPGRVVGKPPEWFTFDEEKKLRFRELGSLTGVAVPALKFLLPRHHDSYLNPFGERLLSRCFWPLTFKKGGFRFWSILMEKYGIPWVIGKVPRETLTADREMLKSRLVQMVQDAVAVINNDESVQFGEAKNTAANSGMFERMIVVSDKEVSKAILHQTLSTELDQSGSLAATQAHLDVKDGATESDGTLVIETVNTLFRWITALNVPNAMPPNLEWQADEDIQKDRSERDNNLNKQGVQFTEHYYKRVYNLTDEDFVLSTPSPAGNGPAFAEGTDPAIQGAEDAAGIADNAALAAQSEMDNMLAPVIEMIQGAKSFEEIDAALYRQYPKMTSDEFQRLMGRAMFAAGMVGATAVMDEARE